MLSSFKSSPPPQPPQTPHLCFDSGIVRSDGSTAEVREEVVMVGGVPTDLLGESSDVCSVVEGLLNSAHSHQLVPFLLLPSPLVLLFTFTLTKHPPCARTEITTFLVQYLGSLTI